MTRKLRHRVLSLLKSKWKQILFSLLCIPLVLFLDTLYIPQVGSPIQGLNNMIYDEMVSLYPWPNDERVRVVIIDIDEQSIEKEGRWPWPRDKMAALLTKLKDDGVVVVALDIVMSEAEINYAQGLKQKLAQLNVLKPDEEKPIFQLLEKVAPKVDNDQVFSDTLSNQDVVMGFLLHNIPEVKAGKLPEPIMDEQGAPLQASGYNVYQFTGYNGSYAKLIDAGKHGGFVSNFSDPDGTIRNSLIIASFNGKIYPSLALETAMRYLLVDKIKFKTHLELGKQQIDGIWLDAAYIPMDTLGDVLIPYFGPPGSLDYYSATDVLRGVVGPHELEGAIALVGSSMILFSDLHEAPMAKSFPGVEMVGNLISGLAGQSIPLKFNWYSPQGILFFVLVGLLFAFIYPMISASMMLILTVLAYIAMLLMMVYLYRFKAFYVQPGYAMLLLGLQAVLNYGYEYVAVKNQKSKISQLFGQYVPQAYVKNLLDSPESYSMEGQTREMTAFFSDIRGFTSLSENLDAAGVKRLLNTFFSPITEIIFNYQGTIDKYVGDMVVAFWGAPMDDPEHARHAIMASLKIFELLPTINQKMEASGLPAVNIGVGLGTGLMNVGDMGSTFRRAYTVLGDTVNLASRLQDLTKFYKVPILTNGNTRMGQSEFLWRLVDKVAVSGRRAADHVYQPIAHMNEASPEMIAEISCYEKAMEAYYAKSWNDALPLFKKLRKDYPDVYIYQLYLARIEEFKANPPPDTWDGVFIHTHK